MAETTWDSIPIEVRLALPHMDKSAQALIAEQYGLSPAYIDRISRFWGGFLRDLPDILEHVGRTYAGKVDDVDRDGPRSWTSHHQPGAPKPAFPDHHHQ